MESKLPSVVDSLTDALKSYLGRGSTPFKAHGGNLLHRLTEVVEQTPESNTDVT
jgi:hypothetical protein